MPPHIGDKYENLYVVGQDGIRVSLDEIRDIDSPYATGGFVPYDMYTPPHPFSTCCATQTFTATIHPQVSVKRLYSALLGLTKREQRLAIRLAERMRRQDLKTGTKRGNLFPLACRDIMNKKG